MLARIWLHEEHVCRSQALFNAADERCHCKQKGTGLDFSIQLLSMNEMLIEGCSWILPESLQSQAQQIQWWRVTKDRGVCLIASFTLFGSILGEELFFLFFCIQMALIAMRSCPLLFGSDETKLIFKVKNNFCSNNGSSPWCTHPAWNYCFISSENLHNFLTAPPERQAGYQDPGTVSVLVHFTDLAGELWHSLLLLMFPPIERGSSYLCKVSGRRAPHSLVSSECFLEGAQLWVK